jgi:hypothetical protein
VELIQYRSVHDESSLPSAFFQRRVSKNCSLEDGNTSRIRNVVLLFRDFRIKYRSHVDLNDVDYFYNKIE